MSLSQPAIATEPDLLSAPEINVLLLLGNADMQFWGDDGSVRWALTPEDVCYLLMLAVELFAVWQPKQPLDAWDRAAKLLGLQAHAEAEDAGG